jgi:hypothetical protein
MAAVKSAVDGITDPLDQARALQTASRDLAQYAAALPRPRGSFRVGKPCKSRVTAALGLMWSRNLLMLLNLMVGRPTTKFSV